jgi:predicted Zn-dependent peptidase
MSGRMSKRFGRELLGTAALATVLLAGTAATAQTAGRTPAAAPAVRPAPVSSLVRSVNIPYEEFTLSNGLRVITHTDRKVPIVAVSVWYGVGSKDEPKGRTGFAHLFEHLMFNGSENAPGEFFEPLENVGATDYNGTTWFDRTNYFQNVPTPALDLALFLESDRMGYLLGAVTQENLTNQIGVVQNEKRQGDNEPYGLTEYAILEGLFPEGHPYRHSTIGSMADLSAATLDTVRDWFRTHYGPNNAVLVLAGDIDARTARPMVEKYFGSIPRGRTPPKGTAGVPERTAITRVTMQDQVANARLYRVWAVPGRLSPEGPLLDTAAAVLAGGTTSRLYNDLVRDKQLAVAVRGYLQEHQLSSFLQLEVDVRPGVEVAAVETRLDQLMADFLRRGPTADEVSRVATRAVAGTIRGLEEVGGFGGKAVTLAEGELYADDPGFYRKQLDIYARATPATVLAASRRWINDGDLRLTVLPGPRPADESAAAGASAGGAGGINRPRYYQQPASAQTGTGQAAQATAASRAAPAPVQQSGPAAANTTAPTAGVQQPAPTAPQQPTGRPPAQATPASQAPQPRPQADAASAPRRSTRPQPMPTVQGFAALDFPDVQRLRLSNGMEVQFVRRATVPVVQMALSFDAGIASDSAEKPGLATLTAALLDEGTPRRTSVQVAEEAERLGASLSATAGVDRTRVAMSALKPNLAASLDLLADVVRNPAFNPADVERLRTSQLNRIAQELTQPSSIASREIAPLIFGPNHPYGKPLTGSGTPTGVQAITRADLQAYQQRWLRPDTATLFVVGDATLAELRPQLERAFGTWRAPAVPRGVKTFTTVQAPAAGRIVLIDRPSSPQSVILGGLPLPLEGTDDPLQLSAANEILGGSFTSRLNTDLREVKGWSYGVRSQTLPVREQLPFLVSAPVQTDRTADSLKALIDNVRDFQGPKPATPAEISRMVNSNVRSLPGDYETSAEVLGALERNALLSRPDDYLERLPARYQALSASELSTAARAIDPARMTWVVVGDRARIEAPLRALNLGTVEVRAPSAAAPATTPARPAGG